MRHFKLAIVLLVVLASFLVAIPNARAAPCFDYDQILPEVDRVALAAAPVAVVVGGSHAFVAVSGAGLQVVDVSNPAALAVIATLGGLGTLKDVALDGTLLYAGSTTGLHVIDVSNPALPALLGSAPGSLESVDFLGKTVAAAGTTGLRYYDVTDPAAPMFVSTLPLGGSALEVLAHGDLFYALAGNTLYAASNDLEMPSVLGQTSAISTRGLAAEGDALFNWQMVYSIANPSSPVMVGAYSLPFSPDPSGPEVVGTTAFVPGSSPVLQVVDIDTAVPGNSRVIGFVDFSNWPVLAVEIAGGYAYVGTRNIEQTGWRLHVIDVETALVPSPMTVLDTPGNATDVAVQGNYAYVADGATGLQIVDITNPWAPAIAGSVATPVAASEVAVAGNLACVRQGTDLQVIDVSNPANPILAGTYPSVMAGSDVAMTPGFAYVQVQTGMFTVALQVIDVANPAQPVLAGSVPISSSFSRIEITGTTACLLSNDTQFVDISNPSAPVLVGSTGFIGSSPIGMAVDGTRVYINEVHGKFLAFDISNPAMPVALASLPYSTFRYTGAGMAASRSTVYVYSGNYGLWTLNVGNSSASPKIVSGTVLDTPLSFSMRIADEVLVATVGAAGLLVLPTQCLGVTDSGTEETVASQRVVLRAAWPNPTRAGTSLHFELPVATVAALRVYDVTGRIVRELRLGPVHAGSHTAHWDGLDAAGRRVANGVYITRLETPVGTSSGRVTLVR